MEIALRSRLGLWLQLSPHQLPRIAHSSTITCAAQTSKHGALGWEIGMNHIMTYTRTGGFRLRNKDDINPWELRYVFIHYLVVLFGHIHYLLQDISLFCLPCVQFFLVFPNPIFLGQVWWQWVLGVRRRKCATGCKFLIHFILRARMNAYSRKGLWASLWLCRKGKRTPLCRGWTCLAKEIRSLSWPRQAGWAAPISSCWLQGQLQPATVSAVNEVNLQPEQRCNKIERETEARATIHVGRQKVTFLRTSRSALVTAVSIYRSLTWKVMVKMWITHNPVCFACINAEGNEGKGEQK